MLPGEFTIAAKKTPQGTLLFFAQVHISPDFAETKPTLNGWYFWTEG